MITLFHKIYLYFTETLVIFVHNLLTEDHDKGREP